MHSSVNWVALRELGKIVSGSTPRTSRPEYWGGDIRWITPADLTEHEGVYFRGETRRITQEGFDSCSTTMLPAGSILYSSRAPIGHCAVTKYPLCTNQGFKSLVPNERLDAVYGYFALKYFTPEIQDMGRGATFTEINKSLFGSVCIPLPPLDEQRRIAAILEQADRERRLARFALAQSADYLQSVFLEMFGDPVTNPMGWEQIQFKNVIRELRNGLSPSSQGTTPGIVLTLAAITQNGFIPTERKHALFDRLLADYSVTNDKFLICRGNGNLNLVGMGRFPTHSMPDTIYPDTIIAAQVDTERINASYLETIWNHEFVRQQIEAGARTTSGIYKINQTVIRQIYIPIPSSDTQSRFAEVAAYHRRIRAQQREALRQAEGLFQSLLHRAFRGEV